MERRADARHAAGDRRATIVLVLAAVLFTAAFAFTGSQARRISDLTTSVCEKQTLTLEATRALRPVIQEALRAATQTPPRKAAAIDYLRQVKRLPEDSPASLALRDIGVLIGTRGKPDDISKLLSAERQFLATTSKPEFRSTGCEP